jgi:hypothetical protein
MKLANPSYLLSNKIIDYKYFMDSSLKEKNPLWGVLLADITPLPLHCRFAIELAIETVSFY